MTKSEKQLWEQERAKGRAHFILYCGLLKAGVPYGIVMTVARAFSNYFSHAGRPPWQFFIEFGASVLLFGYIMGIGKWYDRERDYKKPIEEDEVA